MDASSRRTSSESMRALELEQAALVVDAERAVGAEAAGGDDPVAGDDQRQAVVRAERARGALGVRVPGERGELAVRDGLAVGNAAEGLGDRELERRAPVEVDLEVVEGDLLAAEVGGD